MRLFYRAVNKEANTKAPYVNMMMPVSPYMQAQRRYHNYMQTLQQRQQMMMQRQHMMMQQRAAQTQNLLARRRYHQQQMMLPHRLTIQYSFMVPMFFRFW